MGEKCSLCNKLCCYFFVRSIVFAVCSLHSMALSTYLVFCCSAFCYAHSSSFFVYKCISRFPFVLSCTNEQIFDCSVSLHLCCVLVVECLAMRHDQFICITWSIVCGDGGVARSDALTIAIQRVEVTRGQQKQ